MRSPSHWNRRLVAPIRVLAACCSLLLAPALPAAETWILIDTEQRTLELRDGEAVVRTWENIAIGSGGAARSRSVGDQTTPLGTFRIADIREETRYHRFFALNYPALDDALRAYAKGRISESEMAAIRHAHEHGLEPPSSTPIGGNIGIHGLGAGDPRIHEEINWTDGCIALTNEQVDELARWVHPQMTVVIR